MKSIILTIKFLSYWHAGSGEGRGAAADALCLKDAVGLPYLPGKTVKGLLREAARTCEDAGRLDKGSTDLLFGKSSSEENGTPSLPGILRFSNATLPEQEYQWLASPEGEGQRQALFEYHTSTSIDEHGLARDQTLRTIESCLPLELKASIAGPDDESWAETIRKARQAIPQIPPDPDDKSWAEIIRTACALIRSAGSHRNRGLGRCEFNLEK